MVKFIRGFVFMRSVCARCRYDTWKIPRSHPYEYAKLNAWQTPRTRGKCNLTYLIMVLVSADLSCWIFKLHSDDNDFLDHVDQTMRSNYMM